MLSCVQLFETPWTVSCQIPLSMEFPRQECWSRLPFPTPGDLPNPGIKPLTPALAGGFFITEPCVKLIMNIGKYKFKYTISVQIDTILLMSNLAFYLLSFFIFCFGIIF